MTSKIAGSALVVFVAVAASACSDARAACVSSGICDAPAPHRISLDVVCDSSEGSTCTKDAIADTLDITLPAVAERPGSSLRLWAMSGTVDGVVTLGIATSPEFAPAPRARKREQESFVKAERARLLAASGQAFEHPAAQSPVADTLARVLMAATNDNRSIVVISDMREFQRGRFDFECGPLPAPADFAKRLEHDGVIGHDAMKGVTVAFSFVGVPAVDKRRCAATIQRARAIESIWRQLVTSAGGTVLVYTDGAIRLADLSR